MFSPITMMSFTVYHITSHPGYSKQTIERQHHSGAVNILPAVGTIQTLLNFLTTHQVLLVVPLPHKVGGGSLRLRLQPF